MTRGLKDYFGVTDKSNVKKGCVLGLLSGIIVGGVTVLLLAPKSGKETRADIKAGIEVGVEKAKDLGDKASAAAHKKYDEIKTKLAKEAEEVIEEAEEKEKAEK
ncbi:MAG TPA: YtxH domain-containing protein [Clostridiaceae bacterium]|nr:YtxH domain-containing protein [Clostridiaceae bacterium]